MSNNVIQDVHNYLAFQQALGLEEVPVLQSETKPNAEMIQNKTNKAEALATLEASMKNCKLCRL